MSERADTVSHLATTESLYRELAAELWVAARDRIPVPRISTRFPWMTAEDAYAIQRELKSLAIADGAVPAGYKIGATSEAIRRMFHIDEPDFGFLTDKMLIEDGGVLAIGDYISPKVEAEVAFRMGMDLQGENVTAHDVIAATAGVAPVLEVLDSRIQNWEIELTDTVADNASSALVVMGGTVPLTRIDLAAERVNLTVGDHRETALGSAVMGHPAEAVACLVRILSKYRVGLHAGDLVLAGAWAAAVNLSASDVVEASFGSLGTVTMSVGPALT